MSYHHPGPRPARPGPRRGGRIDPVLVEAGAAIAWLAVGTLGIAADGAGTLLLAFGIAATAVVVVENRRRGPRHFDGPRSAAVLRYGVGAVAVVVVASVLLGLISASAYLPGVAAVATGGALLLLAGSTGQRPTAWLGGTLVVLGVLSAITTTQVASSFASQGLLGLVAGVLLLLSAADRVGLVSLLRDRVR